MVRAERAILRGQWLPGAVIIFLLILWRITDEDWALGALLAVFVIWPLALLLSVGVLRLLKGRRLVAARPLVLLALYAILGWVVVGGVAGALEDSDDPRRVAGAWVLKGLYLIPPLLCLPLFFRVMAIRLRARLGGRTDYYQGILHTAHGRPSQAMEAFSKYYETHPNDRQGLEASAFAMLMRRRYEEALDAANSAIQMGSTRTGLWLKGHVFLAAGAIEEALEAFHACLKERPQLPWVGVFIGIALVHLRRLEDAIRTLPNQKRWRNMPYAAYALGEAYRLSGMFDAAFKAYEIAAHAAAIAEELPFPIRDRGLLACALAQCGRWREAEQAAQSALAADPSDPRALHAQALIEKQRGDLAAVSVAIERMFEASPPSVVSTLGDPQFTSLLTDERFRRLLSRAWLEQNRLLERIRRRAPTSHL